MTPPATVRIALANLRFPDSAAQSVSLAVEAIRLAGDARADIACFPECFVTGYRSPRRRVDEIDAAFLDDAWLAISAAAARANTAVVLGTERLVDNGIRISAIVMNRDGSIAGFQDKVQLDPSEEGIWTPGTGRRIFDVGGVTIGVSICHEAWRYPETVRYAARRGARIVFVPHFHEADRDSYRPTTFADPANTFHEKALLCRAAENTCFVAAVNYASDGSPTTSAVAAPDGTLLAWQPYGQSGLLVVDCDPGEATGLLARRYKPIGGDGV